MRSIPVLAAAALALGAAALALGSSVPAAPRLEAASGSLRSSVAAVNYTQTSDAPAPRRIVFRVPDGYSFSPDAGGAATGAVIGSSVIQVSNEPQPLTGVLTMADAAAFVTEGRACTGTGQHDAVWAVSVGSPRGAFQIPVFVDGRAFAICPDAERLGATATAIALQLGLVSNSGVDRQIVAGPQSPGTFVWSATVARPGLPEVEIRSIENLAQVARFSAKVVRGRVRITGRVTANGRGFGGIRIQTNLAKPRTSGVDFYGVTREDGRFTLVHRIGRGTFLVRVRSYPDQRDVTATGCTGPSSAAGGCVSATQMIVGLAARPAFVRVRSGSG
jgi:hypothetical protein